MNRTMSHYTRFFFFEGIPKRREDFKKSCLNLCQKLFQIFGLVVPVLLPITQFSLNGSNYMTLAIAIER